MGVITDKKKVQPSAAAGDHAERGCIYMALRFGAPDLASQFAAAGVIELQ